MMDTGRFTTADPTGIASRNEFAAFVGRMLADYHGTGSREWENATLERFLEALGAFAGARLVEGGDQETATWRLFGELLVAATGYE